MNNWNMALKWSAEFTLKTPLLLHSGLQGDFADSAIETTPDGKELHINGYVWASLIRRGLARVKGAEALACCIGKYDPLTGVSPLWCEASFVTLPGFDINPGIRVNRKWGAVDIGALFNEEVVPSGLKLTMRATYFYSRDDDDEECLKRKFLSALWVINQGIETIGGGWSYGYGQLEAVSASFINLDLTKIYDRVTLWDFDNENDFQPIPQLPEPEIIKPWYNFAVHAGIVDGQLLAVHTGFPLMDVIFPDNMKTLPDTFVYRRSKFQDNTPASEVTIPGKAIRQAVFATAIERRLRSMTGMTCEAFQKAKKSGKLKTCYCKKCCWFGSTDWGGLIAVTDAAVQNYKTTVINRVQLCEHSMQNNNLFSGEYLTKGTFDFNIFIDPSRAPSKCNELVEMIETILKEMQKDSNAPAPPDWYRLGATSTCTGQVCVQKYDVKYINGKSSNRQGVTK